MLASSRVCVGTYRSIGPRSDRRSGHQCRRSVLACTLLVLIGGANVAPPMPADVETQTRETYNGPLAVGTDLMGFYVRDDRSR
jgi:hypothetical protein